jgi:putative transposase
MRHITVTQASPGLRVTLPLALLERQSAQPLPVSHDADRIWRAWRTRPLEARATILSFGRLPTRLYGADHGLAIYTALAVRADGAKEIAGLWAGDGSEAFWAELVSDLRRRGLSSVSLAAPAPSPGLCRALAVHFPDAIVAPSPLRILKAPLELAAREDRAALTAVLEEICAGDCGLPALKTLAAREQARHPALAEDILRWAEAFAPFFALPVSLRRMISSLEPAPSLSAKLRRRNLCPPSRFASADAALRVLSEVIAAATQDWRIAPGPWQDAQADFAALYSSVAA